MLKPSAQVSPPQGPLLARHAAGLVCIAVGLISLLIAVYLQFRIKQEITNIPDLRVTLPLLAVTIGAGVFAFIRREPMRVIPVAGIAMATSAVFVGWLIVVGIVAVVAAIIIAVLHQLL
jgi:hypothetical protein